MVMRYVNEPVEEYTDDLFVERLGYTRRPIVNGRIFA